jgi:Ni/Co efflux regulator RcnB
LPPIERSIEGILARPGQVSIHCHWGQLHRSGRLIIARPFSRGRGFSPFLRPLLVSGRSMSLVRPFISIIIAIKAVVAAAAMAMAMATAATAAAASVRGRERANDRATERASERERERERARARRALTSARGARFQCGRQGRSRSSHCSRPLSAPGAQGPSRRRIIKLNNLLPCTRACIINKSGWMGGCGVCVGGWGWGGSRTLPGEGPGGPRPPPPSSSPSLFFDGRLQQLLRAVAENSRAGMRGSKRGACDKCENPRTPSFLPFNGDITFCRERKEAGATALSRGGELFLGSTPRQVAPLRKALSLGPATRVVVPRGAAGVRARPARVIAKSRPLKITGLPQL